MRTIRLVASLLFLAVASAGLARAADEPVDSLFERGLALYRSKSYSMARDTLVAYRRRIQESNPGSPDIVGAKDLKDVEAAQELARKVPRLLEAIYTEAECRFMDDDKAGAHELYRCIIDNHKNFPRIAEVINREYEIGSAFIEGKATRPFLVFTIHSESLGVEILEHLIASYQQKYFDYAQYQVADYYFRDHDWRRAADAYRELEENFPESPWAGVAKVQRAQCHLRLCRGYRYDQTEVAKAEQILVDYIRRNQTGSRISEAKEALAQIRSARATLYAENARFYLFRERRPRAALIYAEAILREAPNAPAAERVRGILEDALAQAEERDRPTADRAKELLAEFDRRGGAGAREPPLPSALEPPPTLVPGALRGRGAGADGGR